MKHGLRFEVSLFHYGDNTKIFANFTTTEACRRYLEAEISEIYELLPVIITILSPLIALQFWSASGKVTTYQKIILDISNFLPYFTRVKDLSQHCLTFRLITVFDSIEYLFGREIFMANCNSWVCICANSGSFLGEDSYNASGDQEKKLKRNIWFRNNLGIRTVECFYNFVRSIHHPPACSHNFSFRVFGNCI